MSPHLIWKLTNWYFTKNAIPYWGILLIDMLIVLASGLTAYTLSNGATATAVDFGKVVGTMCIYLIVFVLFFRVFHTYSGIIRYSSFIDLQRVGLAMLCGTVVIFILRQFIPLDEWFYPISGKVLFVGAIIATLVMWMVRVAVKYAYDIGFSVDHAPATIIYGTKAGGISIAKGLFNKEKTQYSIVGFLSDDIAMKNAYLLGKKVMLHDDETVDKLVEMGVKYMLVSPLKSQILRRNTEFVDQLIGANIKILMVPDSIQWDGKSDLDALTLQEVSVEDLLPRDEIKVDMNAIGKLLSGQSIMITGAAGSIGSEMVRQIAVYKPKQLILIDQAETPMHDMRLELAKRWPDIEALTLVTSITKTRQMESIFKKYRPCYVFHAAAYKHVPMMEDNPSNAVQNNCYGTRVIADLSVKYGVKKFVMISTDKAVNPTNVMGCSKRICEIYVQSLNKAIVEGKVEGVTQFVTTRFGNVLGSNGSVIPIFKDQIKNGGPVTVTHPDIIRYFMLIPEACKLVLEAGTMGKGGEIFVFDMGEPVKIVDLAKRMIKLSGAKNVEIKFTGLRDGEKLYEEVLNEKESTKPTIHPKIMIATVREYDYEKARQDEEELYQLSYSYDPMSVVKKMKEIVPEYKSQHSIYEQLDK